MKLSDMPSPPVTIGAVLAVVFTFLNGLLLWLLTDNMQRLRAVENETNKLKGVVEVVQNLATGDHSTMQAVMTQEGVNGANIRHLLTMYYAHEQLLRRDGTIFPAPSDRPDSDYPLSKRQGR